MSATRNNALRARVRARWSRLGGESTQRPVVAGMPLATTGLKTMTSRSLP
jgi:hypothetical protein